MAHIISHPFIFVIVLYRSILYVVALFESFYSSQSVNYPLLTGVERVALAAHFNPELWLGRTGGESIAAQAGYLSIIIKLRMDFLFHYKRSPSFYI